MPNQDNKKRVQTDPVYCSARKTNGDPCRRRPIKGGTVCATHGGSAPQVKEAARRRILAAQDRAAAMVIQVMEDPETPHAVKLAAAKDLLDRGGNAAAYIIAASSSDRIDKLIKGIIFDVDDDSAAETKPKPQKGLPRSRGTLPPAAATDSPDSGTATDDFADYADWPDDDRYDRTPGTRSYPNSVRGGWGSQPRSGRSSEYDDDDVIEGVVLDGDDAPAPHPPHPYNRYRRPAPGAPGW